MGLADDLGYRFGSVNPLQRGLQRLVATPYGARVFARIMPPMDSALARVSGGRASVPELLAGLPVLDVTTTGRRSGLPRRAHLISIPVGEHLALLGTNFGQRTTPTWVLNLESDPRAEVTYRNRTVPVTARPASDLEYDEAFANSAGIYPGYAQYRQRVTGRRIRVFVLEPRVPTDRPG